MASLYDLELHESNNFIHSLSGNGQPLSLKLMEDQKMSFAAMGEAGKAILAQIDDPNSEMGKSYKRLKDLETDLKKVMAETGATSEGAKLAQDILTKNPQSLSDLTEEERKCVSDYWMKKKSIVEKLFAKGYTAVELFS